MLRRSVKRKIRAIIILLFYGAFVILILFFGGIFLKKIISGAPQPRHGDILKPVDIKSQNQSLKEILNKKNILYDYIEEATSGSKILTKITDGPLVYFSLSEPLDWQITSLILILNRFKTDNKKITSIDLTGVRPIVKF